MAFGAARLAAALAALDHGWQDASHCVALSGGIDSVALLHAMRALRDGGRVRSLRAVHADHGLQAASCDWAARCRALCAELDVPLEVVELGLVAQPGASVEAQAREARYAALARLLRPGEWLLTAHHRDDQLETVLIQLLRGAGVAGLAAMPPRAPLGAGWHLRPLLGIDRAAIAAYAAEHALAFLHDPMNESARLDRGWLRSEVLPRLRSRWPAAAATVARSASHLAQASRLLAELAAADARGIADGSRLSVAGLRGLTRDRQANLLRWWIHERGLRPPPATRLEAALDELLTARADGQPLVHWPEGELRRYRGRLYAMRPLPAIPPAASLSPVGGRGLQLGAGCGEFTLLPGAAGTLRADLPAPIEIRFRSGGESLRPALARPRKRVKDLCQEAGIVPWMRGRLPLVYAGGRLAAVADLWVDAEFQAAPGAPALAPVWTGRPELF
jgi:tRNA(Ile)-lysidine synthase